MGFIPVRFLLGPSAELMVNAYASAPRGSFTCAFSCRRFVRFRVLLLLLLVRAGLDECDVSVKLVVENPRENVFLFEHSCNLLLLLG